MKRQDILSILITFLVGLIAGGYLYLTGFAPTVAKLEVPSAETFQSFEVVSEVYGGCRSACPSFQVLGDGSYRYLYSTSFDDEQILQTGTLPFDMRRNLQRTLEAEVLRVQSRKTTPALCESFSDGFDVRYQITIAGEEYSLDTCGTAVSTESALWQSLEAVWTYLESAGNNS